LINRPHRRILIIARSLPHPADDGYRIRVGALARGLARSHEVTLVGHSEGDGTEAVAALAADGIAAHWVPALHHATSIRRVRRLARGRPWFTRSATDAALRTLVTLVAATGGFDLVQLESSEFAGLPLPVTTPVVVDEHNIWSELSDRRRAIRRAGPRGLLDQIEATQVAHFERRVWSTAAGVMFCSDREVESARRHVPAGQFATVPNGVDLDVFRPGAVDANEEPGQLTFVGLLRYTPNADAVRWFVHDILPRVRAEIPTAHFEAVGKAPSPSLAGLAGPGVEITGTIPDVRPALSRAAIVVVPLRVGSGTRIKILEALAMGKAVVSTSIGREGLDLRDGEHLLVADGVEAFAAAVVRLLGDPALRARLGSAGRELVTRGYSWQLSVERLEAFHDEVMSRHGPP
jgi:glycosyltransferase involved in cell wall biosynthesis